MSGRILQASSLFLAITALTASAQTHATDRGSIIIAGDASLSSSKAENDDDRTTTIRLAPSLQYFIRPGLAIGGEVLLSRTSLGNASISQYGVGPRLSYYFGQGARTMHPFVSGSITFANGSSDPGDIDFSSRDVTLRAGLLFMVSNAVGINPNLFYQNTKTSFTNANGEIEGKTNTFGLAVGISAFVF